MKAKCPWCSKIHDSDDHDIGWYIVCCPWTRIVWVKEDGELQLIPVPEDCDEDNL